MNKQDRAITQAIVMTVHAVVMSMLQGKEKDEDQLTVLFTCGEIRAVGEFWLVDWIYKDICAAVIGRTSRAILQHQGVEVDSPEGVIMGLLMLTDFEHAGVDKAVYKQAKKLIAKDRPAKDRLPVDEPLAQKMLQYMMSTYAATTGDDEQDHTLH